MSWSRCSRVLLLLALPCLGAHAQLHAGGGSGLHSGPEGVPPPDNIEAGPRVRELTVFDLRGSIADGRMWFVEYYVPWCRGCKRMAGQWTELSEMVSHNHDIVIARFNCESAAGAEALCDALNVVHTPSLRVYLNAKEIFHYKADFFHVELMLPFITKIHAQHLSSGLKNDTSPSDTAGQGIAAMEAAAPRTHDTSTDTQVDAAGTMPASKKSPAGTQTGNMGDGNASNAAEKDQEDVANAAFAAAAAADSSATRMDEPAVATSGGPVDGGDGSDNAWLTGGVRRQSHTHEDF